MTSDEAPEPSRHEQLLEYVNHDELGWSVVRMHVRIESQLWELARVSAKEPSALPARAPWEALARWTAAAGWLPTELLAPLLELNRLRNRVAHREDDVDAAAVISLLGACPP